MKKYKTLLGLDSEKALNHSKKKKWKRQVKLYNYWTATCKLEKKFKKKIKCKTNQKHKKQNWMSNTFNTDSAMRDTAGMLWNTTVM